MPGFLASARLVGFCTLISRILGMARDTLMARAFGAGSVMDAFGIAWMVPNLFRRLFGEGALTAAFVPAFVSRLETGRKEDAFVLLRRLMTRLVLWLSLAVLVGIGITFVLPLVWRDEKTALVASLTRVMLPYLVLICGAAILGAALNSLKNFFVPAFAPVILNLVWIAPLLLLVDIWTVAWAIVVGGLVQFVMMAVRLWREGARVTPDFGPHEGLGEVGRHMLPVVFGLSLVQINELVDRVIAEACVPGHGAVAALYYGNQLTQLPLSLIGTSIATTIFPALAGAAAKNDEKGFSDLFSKGMRAALYIAIPATVGAIVLARPIIELIYEHGRFTTDDTTRAAGVLTWYIASLWCYCANQVQVRAFHARQDMSTPVKISASMVALNLALNLALVWPFKEAGIAMATSISGLISFLLLNHFLRRRHPELDFAPVRKTFALSLVAAAVMGAAAWGTWVGLTKVAPGPLFDGGFGRVAGQALRCLAPILAGAATYFGVTWLMGMREVRVLLRRGDNGPA
jgi:putative peptidoglycan lipid II flippase